MERGYSPGVQEDVGHGCVETVKRNDHPNDHRLVGCRWVFKVKRNGVYHARLVAKGFSQIPGVDFTDNYSPVVNDVTFRVVVARMIIENRKGKVVDIVGSPQVPFLMCTLEIPQKLQYKFFALHFGYFYF